MRTFRHASAVVIGFTLLFTWLYARPLVENAYLAGTDLYDYYLPIFLSPITLWSTFELSGMPAFADSQNAPFYPVNLLFARLLPSWTAYIVSAYVLAASFTYAYVYHHTQSKIASAFAGVVYGMSEALMERVDHIAIVHATAWLPLVALAIDRVRESFVRPRPGTTTTATAAARWVAIGAFAVGCCFLAGHTQPAIYITYVAGLYALAGGIADRATYRYYGAVFALFVAGGLLAAVSAFPLWEARSHMVRQTVGFSQFVSHSNSPAQMLSFLLPAIVHEGRDGATYVGLATVVFALLAFHQTRHRWLTAFWLVAAVLALMTGMGESTPLAGLLYGVPLYDSFRVVARHLFLAAFGFAVLAGIGISALGDARVSRAAIGGAIVAVVLALAAGAVIVAWQPASFAIDPAAWPVLHWPALPPAIAAQLIIGVATGLVCLRFARRPFAPVTILALLSLIVLDLAHALPYPIRWFGVEAPVIPVHAIEPSVHAKQLAAGIAPRQQRVMQPAGVTVDPVVPGAFARLWRIPVAGGYGAIMTSQYASLARMGTTGAVDRHLLSHASTGLDLLAVKYVVIPKGELVRPATLVIDGTIWIAEAMNLPVGPPECGQRHPRVAKYSLPPGIELTRLSILAALRCSEDVPQGTEAATLRIIGEDGRSEEVALRAGVDIAEAGLASPELRRRARHQQPRAFTSGDDNLLAYVIRFETAQPIRGARLEFQVTGTAGWLQLRSITATDTSGNDVPVPMLDLFLSSAERWRRLPSILTARTTDRGADEHSPYEEEMVVFENLRALPRAWMASEAIPLSQRDMLTAIHYSLLPDGRPFDPARMALVDSDALAPVSYAGEATARVESVEGGSIQVAVASAGGGFLILSESYYPGWRARIGDRTLPVQRTNVALQGVVVPPGQHTVTFEFAPASFRVGAGVSGITLLVLLVVFVGAGLKTRPSHRT